MTTVLLRTALVRAYTALSSFLENLSDHYISCYSSLASAIASARSFQRSYKILQPLTDCIRGIRPRRVFPLEGTLFRGATSDIGEALAARLFPNESRL